MVRYMRVITALCGVLAFMLSASTMYAATTERVSVDDFGAEGNADSSRPSVSADGRYVAFYSDAYNLVPGDSPPYDANTCQTCTGVRDVFVRDTVTSTIVRVSVTTSGVPGNDKSDRPAISGDGRFVAFVSDATNLVAGDMNGARDIFLHDRDTDADGIFDEPGAISTIRVSVSSAGVEANDRSNIPHISEDGRQIAFRSRATNLIAAGTLGIDHVYVHDRVTGTTSLVSVSSAGDEGNGTSDRPFLSSNGRYVTYFSDAYNLVAGDDPTFDPIFCPSCTGVRDVFVHDRDPDGNGVFDEGNGQTERASVDSSGVAGNGESTRPTLSADGRYVQFKSLANNLVPGDTNNADDVFVHDRQTGQTVRVSVSSAQEQSAGAGPESGRASVSFDGRHVAFYSDADNLVPGDTNGFRDVFVRDRLTGTTIRVSETAGGAQGNGDSDRPSISADGRYVAFYSDAYNLITGDLPTYDPVLCPSCTGVRDVFVYDRDPDGNGTFDEGNATIERVSVSSTGVPANGSCNRPDISPDGRYVTFRSSADTLVLGDTNLMRDIFVHDRTTGATVRVNVSDTGAEALDGDSDEPSISANGRYVAFWSAASNLVPGDTPTYDSTTCPSCTGVVDVFVHDRDPDGNGVYDEGNGTTVRASRSSSGVAANGTSDRPVMSADGRYVGFISDATNLVAGDLAMHTDIFVHDLITGSTIRASVGNGGVEGDYGADRVTLSADGRYVGFRSKADNLVPGDLPSFDADTCPSCVGERDVFVRDRDPDGNGVYDEGNGTTTRVSVNAVSEAGDRESGGPKLSGDGTVMAFVGPATNLVPGDTNFAEDVFAAEWGTGSIERANVSSAGAQTATPIATVPDSDDGGMSADGRYVCFRSFAVNLTHSDQNLVADVFLHDRDADGNGVFDEAGGIRTTRLSVNSSGLEGDLGSGSAKISADGTVVAYYSDATTLVNLDTNNARDVFASTVTAPECVIDADCNDGNPCTTDMCNQSTGACVHANNYDPCDDGDQCTGNDVCGGGTCAGTLVVCPGVTTCDPADGLCKGCTSPADCDDGNVCTDDTCNASTTVCVFTDNTNACDDGDLCTENDVCGGGICTGTSVVCPGNFVCDPSDGVCKDCSPVWAPTADPSAVKGNRYISIVPGNPGSTTAIRVTFVDLVGFPLTNGESRWVGPPHEYPEEDSSNPGLTFTASKLSCDPYFHDWSTVSLLRIYGGEIMPDSTYEVREVSVTCSGNLGDVSVYSAPLAVLTAKWGDVAPLYDDPANPPQPDFNDISGMVQKFLAAPGAPVKASAQLLPNVVFPDRSLNFKDIAADVAAFVGTSYPNDPETIGPCACPSSVTCGATPCVNDNVCGQGFCIGGFCMDPCGRCSP